MMKTSKKVKTDSTKTTAKAAAAKRPVRRSEPVKAQAPVQPELANVVKPLPASKTAALQPKTVPAGPAETSAPKPNKVSLELVKPEAKQVFVAGSFNQWQPEKSPMVRLGNGRWVGDLQVKPGRHEYLFVVDGQWVTDPNAKETVANPFGGQNSVLIVSE